MAERVRRTQAERTATTQATLLDATIDCLLEVGYARTTTTEVTRRAGVSMGALLHHFPTKADLLAAAVRHVLTRRQSEFRAAMADLPMGADRVDAAIDQLWTAMSGAAFVAWVELWVAARTDPVLAEAVRAVEDEFHRTSEEIFAELFPAEEYPDSDFLQRGRRFAFALMDGVALVNLVQPTDDAPIEMLKGLTRMILDRPDPGATT